MLKRITIMEKVSGMRGNGRSGRLVIFTLIAAVCVAGYFAFSFMDQSMKFQEEHHRLSVKYSKLYEEYNNAESTIEKMKKKSKENDVSIAALQSNIEKVKQEEKNCMDREKTYKEKELLLSTCQGQLGEEKTAAEKLRANNEKLQKEISSLNENITLMKEGVEQTNAQKATITDMEKLVADLQQQNKELHTLNNEQEKMLNSKNQNNEQSAAVGQRATEAASPQTEQKNVSQE